MGAGSSVVQHFEVYGDGNVFSPDARQATSAVPQLDLNIGDINPGGICFTLVSGARDPSSAGALRRLTTRDVSQQAFRDQTHRISNDDEFLSDNTEVYFALTEHAIEQFGKLENACEIDRAYLNANGLLTTTFQLRHYYYTHSCYVGVSAEQAAKNFVKDAKIMSSRQLISYFSAVQNALTALAQWEVSIRQVMNLIPMTTPFGSTKCDMTSVVQFLDANLPEEHPVRYFPYEAALSISRRNGGIRFKDKRGETLSNAVNAVSSAAGAPLSNALSPAYKSSIARQALNDLDVADIDVLSSSRPIASSVLARSMEPQQYNIRALPASSTMWLRQLYQNVSFEVGWENTETHTRHYFEIKFGTKAIHLNSMGSMNVLVNYGNKSYSAPGFDPDHKQVYLLLVQSKIPFEDWKRAEDIIAILPLASTTLHAEEGSFYNTKLLDETALNVLFEKELIAESGDEVNSYMLCTFVSDQGRVGGNAITPFADAWDANTTFFPLTLGDVSVNGTSTHRVTPSVLFGSYTPDILHSALPNEAGLIIGRRMARVAGAIKADDSTNPGEVSVYSTPITGRLILQQSRAQNVRGTAMPHHKGALFKLGSRALHMFMGRPESVMLSQTPIVRDSSVMVGLLQGARDGLRNKSISAEPKISNDSIGAMRSVQLLHQGLLNEVQTLYPPLKG
ncbi:outer shell protein [Baboon orthoreovirus]|uniref:Outer shell protein n=1 Tax=Baboon orthoreovirus TaxID=75888 RepID=G0YZM3_9REOV|nr:outer shell protein [Baboon orthoreovirus]AEK86193.1 outer shell protein [Baboon orthoreovirus]